MQGIHRAPVVGRESRQRSGGIGGFQRGQHVLAGLAAASGWQQRIDDHAAADSADRRLVAEDEAVAGQQQSLLRQQQARGACGGETIAEQARAIIGNATVVAPATGGWLTFWPNGAAQPLIATSNFTAGQIFNRQVTAGLDATGLFNVFTTSLTELVIDVSGYFAP